MIASHHEQDDVRINDIWSARLRASSCSPTCLPDASSIGTVSTPAIVRVRLTCREPHCAIPEPAGRARAREAVHAVPPPPLPLTP